MLRNREPLKDSWALVGAFYEKSMYKARRKHGLTSKQFSVLHQSYILQHYGNGFVSPWSLRSLLPDMQRSVDRYITVLLSKGFLEPIESFRVRKVRSGSDKNKLYNVTITGENVIKSFSYHMTKQVNEFKASKNWKRINPEARKHYERLGVIHKKGGN